MVQQHHQDPSEGLSRILVDEKNYEVGEQNLTKDLTCLLLGLHY